MLQSESRKAGVPVPIAVRYVFAGLERFTKVFVDDPVMALDVLEKAIRGDFKVPPTVTLDWHYTESPYKFCVPSNDTLHKQLQHYQTHAGEGAKMFEVTCTPQGLAVAAPSSATATTAASAASADSAARRAVEIVHPALRPSVVEPGKRVVMSTDEHAHVVKSVWHDVPLLNGWCPNSQDPKGNRAQYCKHSGVVWLRGLLEHSSGKAGQPGTCCQLPEGYRPSQSLRFAVDTGGHTHGAVYVNPDGNVAVMHYQPGHLSLDSITFLAI